MEKIYDKCDVALDAMGRHRVGVDYNSSLKGKEYLAKGIPIVSGVKTELDFDPDFKYYYRVPADDSSIDIDAICDYLSRLYQNESPSEISKNIREYAETHVDVNVVYKKVSDYFKLSH